MFPPSGVRESLQTLSSSCNRLTTLLGYKPAAHLPRWQEFNWVACSAQRMLLFIHEQYALHATSRAQVRSSRDSPCTERTADSIPAKVSFLDACSHRHALGCPCCGGGLALQLLLSDVEIPCGVKASRLHREKCRCRPDPNRGLSAR